MTTSTAPKSTADELDELELAEAPPIALLPKGAGHLEARRRLARAELAYRAARAALDELGLDADQIAHRHRSGGDSVVDDALAAEELRRTAGVEYALEVQATADEWRAHFVSLYRAEAAPAAEACRAFASELEAAAMLPKTLRRRLESLDRIETGHVPLSWWAGAGAADLIPNGPGRLARVSDMVSFLESVSSYLGRFVVEPRREPPAAG